MTLAQRPTQFCSNCGSPLQTDQRFCSNCGSTLGINASIPTQAASNTPQAQQEVDTSAPTHLLSPSPDTPHAASTQPNTPNTNTNNASYAAQSWEIAPPPPVTPAFNPYNHNSPGAQTNPPYTYTQPNQPVPYVVPAYAQKPKRSWGCLITSIILLLVLIAGISGLVFYSTHKSPTTNNQGSNTPVATTHGNTPAATTPTTTHGNTPPASITSSEQLNLAIVYAGVNITITSIQEASNFPNDNEDNRQGSIVRVNLHESNTSASNPDYIESDAILLILPEGTTLQATSEQANVSPDAGINRTNWLDFSPNNTVALNRLTLRLGIQGENQMSVPLKPGANLNQYHDRTANLNTTFQYAGFRWTIKTATLSYSYNSQQAKTNEHILVLNLSADNTTSNEFINVPTNYMRIKIGGTSIAPDNATTFPSSVAANTTVGGLVGFPVPQNAKSFTLVMLAASGISQTTVNFQIP